VVAPEFLDFAEARIQEKVTAEKPAEHITTYELEWLAVDGRRVPVEITSRLTIDNGRPTGVVGYVRDLTERREAELTKIREAHHRVKNNLHTISLLLANEKRRAEHGRTREVLTACRERVLVMAELHEQLYKTTQLDKIDVNAYFSELTTRLLKTYQNSWQQITPRVSIDPEVVLSLDTLIPIALVVHELISNCLKHAFPQKADGSLRHGALMLNLSRRDSIGFKLTLTDTGIGLPLGFNPHKTRSLGMRLIYGLLEKQLKARVSFDSGPSGTTFTTFFVDNHKLYDHAS
jgi:two-component sensor histidine kinase